MITSQNVGVGRTIMMFSNMNVLDHYCIHQRRDQEHVLSVGSSVGDGTEIEYRE